MCETFDLVVSNPPFGVTLAAETRAKISSTFSLPEGTPSEGLFIERCFQLLKPGGRLAVIVPESLLNGKGLMNVRLFIYRMFNIKAIVSMPRNLFIDTPTKTSILFAEKKQPLEIETWDKMWETSDREVVQCIKNARLALTSKFCQSHTASDVADAFEKAIKPILPHQFWVIKGGTNPELLRTSIDWSNCAATEAAEHYRSILKTVQFRRLCDQSILKDLAKQVPNEFPVYEIDEVGYKLSKRGERARPNQLMKLRSRKTNHYITNLHLAEEECDSVIDTDDPRTVLDEILAGVTWS